MEVLELCPELGSWRRYGGGATESGNISVEKSHYIMAYIVIFRIRYLIITLLFLIS